MLRFAVVAQQFAAGTPTLHENFLAVPAGDWVTDVHRAGGQLGRFARSGAEEYAAFVQGPEIRGIVALRLKKEKLSVSSPFSAAFVGSGIPTRKQRMKIAAVRGRLPNGAIVGAGIMHGKAQCQTIGRPAEIVGGAGGSQ